MTYKFRISLPGIKGFARIYEVNGNNSLYHFHKQMLYDMDFPQDQVVLFKAFDAKDNVVARFATIDLGFGSIEHILAGQAVASGIVRFEYFYDTTNKKSVIITLEEENPKGTQTKPTLIESKGPNPEEFLNGYVAFEDLPPEKQRRLENPDEDDEDIDTDGFDNDDEDEVEDEDFEEKYPDEDENV